MKKNIFFVICALLISIAAVQQVSAQMIAPPESFQRPKQASLLQYLEPGFPVQTYETPGYIHRGPVINAVVTDLDPSESNHKQIIVSGASTGGVYAFRSNGQPIAGWPIQGSNGGYGYVAGASGQIFSGFYTGTLELIGTVGQKIWTRNAGNFMSSPPSLVQYNNNLFAFTGEEDWKLHGYNLTDKTILSGWPVATESGIHSPTIANIDNTPEPEIIAASGATISGVRVQAFRFNGTTLPGWPVTVASGSVETFPVVGDLDGDGKKEIVVLNRPMNTVSKAQIMIYTANGTLKKQIALSDKITYASVPALADMNGDNKPEIVVQSDNVLSVVKADGSSLPGFPLSLVGVMGNSSPVVGDVDGQPGPEIVFTTQSSADSANGFVHIVNNQGKYLLGAPMGLPIGAGAVPAISDIDSDSHNEIVITSNVWMTSNSGNKDKVWVFDLSGRTRVTHGTIEWGQFKGDEMHSGEYKPIKK